MAPKIGRKLAESVVAAIARGAATKALATLGGKLGAVAGILGALIGVAAGAL